MSGMLIAAFCCFALILAAWAFAPAPATTPAADGTPQAAEHT